MSVWLAKLTPDDVLIGFEEAEAAPPGAVVVPADCDLKTDGRYRYNRDAARFDPRPEWLLDSGATAVARRRAARAIVDNEHPDTLPPDAREIYWHMMAAGVTRAAAKTVG